MSSAYTLGLFAGAFGASALGGVLGMASGIFIVPILTMLSGVDLRAAIGASIVSVIACSCSSAAQFLKENLTNLRLALVLEMATTGGAVTGVFLIGIVPPSYLYFLFSAVLALSAQQMLARRADRAGTIAAEEKDLATTLRLHSSYPDETLGRDVVYKVSRVPLGMSLMYGAGLISALLGIGSGVLKIPAMDTALRLPIKVSSATSNFMIGVTAAASGVAYFIRGDIDSAIAAPVALGSVAGSMLGAKLLLKLPSGKLRLFFVIVLAALSVQMLFRALGIHLPV
jgi:uncharacterized membrane protein YfcA